MRPQPGAAATAARAAALGLETVVAPLFAVRPVAWTPPPAGAFDALLLTSANAPRQAGPKLADYRRLPCYCVGEATAAAAGEAGLTQVLTGPADGAAAVALAAADGAEAVLHLAGREHVAIEHPLVRIERRVVYAAEPLPLSAAAVAALQAGAVTLLHSPRAARRLAALVDAQGLPRGTILAISAAAARAAGGGWAAVHVAAAPRDAALLALAAQLCQNG